MKRVYEARRAHGLWALALSVVVAASLAACDKGSGDAKAGGGEESCTGDGASKCISRGLDLQEGTGGEKNPVGAVELYMEVCDGGDMRGCTMAAHVYADGAQGDKPEHSIAIDNAKALSLYERACAGNEGNACFHAGNAYGIGKLETKEDPKKAYQFLKAACEHGGPPEACEFAELVKATAEMPSPEERETKCRGGDVQACQDLGMDYRKGSHGFTVNAQKALEIFGVGCDAGDGGSCAMAALIHEKGELGAEPDLAQVEGLLGRACDANFTLACKSLGRHLFTGKLLAKDAKRAVPLLDKACSASDADFEACTWLAIAYRDGEGVKADKAKSTELLTRACDEGKDDLACQALGR